MRKYWMVCMNLTELGKELQKMYADQKVIDLPTFNRLLKILIRCCSHKNQKDIAFLRQIRNTIINANDLMKVLTEVCQESTQNQITEVEIKLN